MTPDGVMKHAMKEGYLAMMQQAMVQGYKAMMGMAQEIPSCTAKHYSIKYHNTTTFLP